MLISASRRTDLPAWHADWFASRLRAGFVEVANPYNPKQIRRVGLAPDEVTAFVFWTRDPRPFWPVLDLLDERWPRYYFQFTLTGYGPDLEPGLPEREGLLDAFCRLSDRLGPERVLWRYDPIVLSSRTPPDFHRRAFEALAARLTRRSAQVTISLVEYYRKTDRRLRSLEQQGVRFERRPQLDPATFALLADLRGMAAERGMRMRSCASALDLGPTGIEPGACVDPARLRALWSIDLPARRDPGQRPHCGCAPSRDIGTNDTCPHGCLYCYANR